VLENAPFIDPLTAIGVISYSGYILSSQKPKEKKE